MDKPLEIKIVDGMLVISIGITTLKTIVDASEAMGEHHIGDENLFLRSLNARLTEEEEDGTTLVHRMLDAAVEAAIDEGDEGFVCEDED